MIMSAQPSQYGISRDTNARGQERSRRLGLYTRSIFGGLKTNPLRASAACGGRLRLGCKIDQSMEIAQDQINKLRRQTVHRTGAAPHRV
jgi:hypothetical protein